MDKTKIQKQLEEYVRRLKTNINPKKVILFGSFASGRATEWSDIDILVISDQDHKGRRRQKQFDILYDLHDGLTENHEFHVYGVSEKEFDRAKPWTIFHDIKREGVIIYSQ